MPFGQRSSREPGAAETGRTLAMRVGRVGNILLVLAVALPIVTAVSIFGAVNIQFWRALPPFDPLLSKIERAQRTQGVVSGDDPVALKRLYLRLEGMTALAAEAKRAEVLHVIFHSFDAAASMPQQRVALNLAGIGASAAVLIADRPVLWQIGGAPNERAKLGFEGPFAFDLAGASDGLLAGFRVGAFGAGETASPRDYAGSASDHARRRVVCRALDRWRHYFGVTKENLYVWSVTDAHSIAFSGRSVAADKRMEPDTGDIVGACDLRARG